MKTRQPEIFGERLSVLAGGVTLGSKTTNRNKMKTTSAWNITLNVGLVLLTAGVYGAHAQPTVITKANTTTMSAASDWGGTVPTNTTIGNFTSVISSGNEAALTLGGNVTLAGLAFGTTLGPVSIANTGGFTNTLDTSFYTGLYGIDLSSANHNVTFNDALKLKGEQAWYVPPGLTLTINGLLTTTGSGVDFDNLGGTLSGTTLANVNGILGPWATMNYGSAYATLSGGVVSAYTGGVPLPIFGAVATVNYTVSASTALTVGESANTVQFNSGATVSGQTLTLNGIMNPGNAATISSGITIGANQELVINGSGNTTLSGTIVNNTGGASGLTYNGTGELFVTGANSFTGNVVINSGILSDNRSENSGNPTVSALGNPQTAGRTVTINNGATLSLDTGGGNDFGNGTTIEQLGLIINQGGTVNITSGNATVGPITLNGGTLNSTATAATGNQYGAYGFGSTVTVGGTNTPSTISAALPNSTFNLTVNGGAGGSYTTFNVANVTGDASYANSDLNVSAVLGNSQGSQSPSGFIKMGAGTMTLTAPNIYTFGTVISNGTLVVNNTSGSATGTGSVTNNGGRLGGTGTISGNVVVNSTGHTLPGGGMTTTIGGNLTYNTGGEADFTLANTYTGTNDQIILNGAASTLSGSGVNVGIYLTDLLHTNLDTTGDYTLITNLTGNNIAGAFASTPVFLGGLVPTNAANFSVVTYANAVVLHYSPIIITTALATPNPASHNQLVTISVTATTTAAAATITGITVNASPIGGSSSLNLVLSGGNTYTNSVVVSPSTAPASLTLTATVHDSASDVNTYPILLVVVPASEVWDGLAATNTWANVTNWVSGLSPLIGDLVTFTGTVQTNVNMESSYSIGWLLFTNAGSFNITNAANTLTLTGSVTNLAPNVETLSVPVNLAGVETFNAVSNNLVFSNTISGAGGVIVSGSKTNLFDGANTYTGATTVNGNLLLANANALSGSTNVTFNSGAKLLLRADTSTVFQMATTTNLAQNASDTLNFDVNSNLLAASGQTLSVTNGIYFPAVANQTINVTGNTNTTLGLGPVDLVTSSHNPYFAFTVNAIPTGPQISIPGILTGNWGNYVNFTGGGRAIVNGPLSNTSNGSMNLFVTGNTTLTLGPLAGLIKANTGDAYRLDVISGTLVLDNSTALTALTYYNGTGIGNPYFILGAQSTLFTISGTLSPASGVLITANNSSNAAIYLGDANNLTGGLSVPAALTNYVSNGDTGFANSGVFTIGGQNTSGINTYNDTIILGLTANTGKSVTLVATAGGEVDFAGSILANGTNTTAGVNVGDGVHTGTVAFTGSSATSTYGGGTTVTNAILRIDNNTGGATGFGTVTVNNGGILGGGGVISSAVVVNSGGATYPGTTNGNTLGLNTTINGNLTYYTGGSANFNVSGSYGSHDEQITMSPLSTVTGTNVPVGIHLTSGTLLDTTSDYILFTSFGGNVAGVFASTPTWLGTTPANAAGFSIVTYATSVNLHYNVAGILVTGTATPNPSSHGHLVTVNVTATAPAGVSSVYVSSLSIPVLNSGLQLTHTGGNNYSGSFTIDASVAAGVNTLTVTVTDNSANANSVPILLTTAPVNEVWDGGAATNTWAAGLNWISGLSPAAGDLVTFAGTVQTNVNMESSYTVGSVTFTNGAGSFNITNVNNQLTLLGGVTNLSTSVQTLSVPITLQGPTYYNPSGLTTLNAASNNIVITNVMQGNGGILSTSAAGYTNTLGGNNYYTGLTVVNNGVLNLSGNEDIATGTLQINGGTLLVSGAGQLDGGTDSDNITNNGTINYSGTNSQTFTGFIFGNGGLTLNSPTNVVVTIGTGTGNVPANPYTYTGPTVVNSGELAMNFANEGLSGIYLSSGLTINNGGVVMALGSSALEGYTQNTTNLPVTINAGGVLSANNSTIFAAHLYGVLTLDGGTLADVAVPDPTYGGWDINNKVVVNGGTNTSYITDPYCIPAETGGTVFNITNGGTPSGIDLDILGSFTARFSGSPDSGVLITNNGTMAYETTNTYNNVTSIGLGSTLILNTNGLMLSSNLNFYAGAITNNGTFVENSTNPQAFLGVISGTGVFNIKNPLASLALAGANTFAGTLNVNNGILLVSNLTGSAIGTGTVNVNNGGKLGGHGGIIGGNVDFNSGGELAFNLDTTTGSAANDQISLSASAFLNPSNGVVGINLLNGSLAASDYVLMNYVPGTFSGVFTNKPVWLGTVPGNAANYSIVTLSNTVVLHYVTGGFNLYGSAGPNPASRNALVTFTVTATGANTITSVSLNASSIGGSSAVTMTPAGANTWTASVAVSSTTPAGSGVLPFTVQDNMGNTGLSSIPLTILPANEIWTGGGSPNNNWVTGANWLSGLGPIYGDLLNFAGTIQTNVNMETSYTIGSITFSNNAGPFTITNNGANTLTLNGGVTNNSANPQTLGMTINVNSVQTFNAAAGNIIITNVITGAGGVNATGTATTTNVLVANNTYTGTTAVNGGTLELLGSETIFGQMSINAGTMLIAGAGQVNGGNFAGNVLDNGSLVYNGTNAQSFTGSVFGSGGFTMGTPTNIQVTFTGTNAFSGNIVINSGIWSDQNNQNGTLSPLTSGLGNTTTVGKTVTINSGGTLSVDAGGFLGNGSSDSVITFIINSNGFMRFTAVTGNNQNNSTMGNLVLNGGRMDFQVSGYSQAFGPVAIGGPIIVGGTSPSFLTNSYAAAFGVNLAIDNHQSSKTITVTNATGDATYSNVDFYVSAPLNDSSGTGNPGNITTVALIKAGPGTMQLSGTNLYSGGNTISGGTIVVANGDNLTAPSLSGATGPGNTGGVGTAGALGKPGILVTLGDTNTTINSSSAALVINGPFSVNHPITISTNPAVLYTLGAIMDTNSSFSNLVTLSEPLTISQVANAGANALSFNGGITSANTTNTVTFTGPGNVVVVGTTGMTDGSGQLAVVVNGGTLLMNATNNYSGGTRINSGGTLAGTGAVSGFVTNYSGGNLTPGKYVGAAGTMLTISNLTLLAGSTSTLAVSHGNINDQIAGQAVSYGGTLTVTSANAAALAANDTFLLFSENTSYGLTSFAATNLPTLSAGLAWNTSNLGVNGTISVVSVVTSPPTLGSVMLSGGSLIMSGTNGTPFAQYRILSSTNVATPLASWLPIWTNTFSATGGYSYTNSPLTNRASFFRLVTP